MKVLVTGSRSWKDDFAVEMLLAGALRYCTMRDEVLEIIEGGARGADACAARFGVDHPRVVHSTFTANWHEHDRSGSWSQIKCNCAPHAQSCKAAGIRRNVEMLNYGCDIVLAFADKLGESRGTNDMVNRARAAGIKCYHLRTATA